MTDELAPTLEEVLELFLAQRRTGAAIRARAFAARYPELGRELLDALESAEAVERVQAENVVPPELAHVERLGAFRIVREIGRGGMGVVLEAFEEPLGRRVALKLLPPELLASASARTRLQREAELAARLDHPGVCTVFGAGVTDGQPWIAMRFVEGTALGKLIAASRERGRRHVELPNARGADAPHAIAACIARIARALVAAHANGVLHRDVKPSNVMVKPGGEPVLLDFGLAIEPDSDAPSLTLTGETAGTPAYLAPELIAGEARRPDERCDVYALGVTLYECLALEPPYRAPTREALYHAVLSGNAADLSRIDRAVPRDLAVIAATAIERDRARRYASAEHLAADLEAFVAGRPIAARPIGSLGRLARWARREPRQALLAGALTTVALVASLATGILIASRADVRAGRAAQRAQDIEATVFDAFAAYGDMRYDDAEASFERVLALDAADADARIGRVLLRIVRKRDDEALALLEGAPHTPAYDGLRAMVSHQLPPPEDPEWLARATSFELFIDGDRFLIEAGRSRRGERAEWARKAVARFENAVARAPRAREVYHVLWSVSASFAGDERAARAAAAGLVALWPDSPRALYQAAFGIGDFDPRAAIPLLERAIALDPNYAPAFVNLGNAHHKLGNLEAAHKAHERALEIDPRRVEAYLGLARVLYEMNCRDEARSWLTRALAFHADSALVWSHLQSFATDCASSARAGEHALELDPGMTDSRGSYAFALECLGELRASCDQFGICVAQEPGNPRYWTAYARTLIGVGEPATALDAIAVARSLDPRDAQLDKLEDRAHAGLEQDE